MAQWSDLGVLDLTPRAPAVQMTVREVTFAIDSGKPAAEAVAAIRDRFHTRQDGRPQLGRSATLFCKQCGTTVLVLTCFFSGHRHQPRPEL